MSLYKRAKKIQEILPIIEAELGEKLGSPILETDTVTVSFQGQPGEAERLAYYALDQVELESFTFQSNQIVKRRFRSDIEYSEATVSGDRKEVEKFLAIVNS